LPLSDTVKDAILDHQGPMGRALACTLALENAEWSAIAFENLDQDDMLDAYKEAIHWTDGVIKSF
jgi:EAL and modified HD-GYP domain-containing signal transduction protein